MPRCTRRDEGSSGCARERNHRGKCAVRPDAARMYASGDYAARKVLAGLARAIQKMLAEG